MRITFLVRTVWGIGGTIRTTVNTAEALAERGHDVAIASCVRNKAAPDFDIDPRIAVRSLWDVRAPADGGEALSPLDAYRARRPSFLDADNVNNMKESSRLLDRRVKRFFQEVDTDILVTTQASLNLYAAAYARPDTVVVAQEHLFLDNYRPAVRSRLLAACDRFDALVVITEADARAYREALRDRAGIVEVIPNSVPANTVGPSPLTAPVIMSAGRLTSMKGFDLLVEAFGEIAHRYPDWSVRVYGRGPEKKRLHRLIGEYGLRGRIKLMGPVSPLDPVWQEASIAAVTSHYESFGLILVEAMAAGVPVVATAVKQGPIELVDHEVNGLLVEPKNAERLAEALARLMDDAQLRRKLADGGRATARTFEPYRVVALHERLFERLLADRRP
ncbi:glycosyltransferase [Glycomyces paridis]|uniref:Glycosyltransferase family 4 protein n=1 Tax=Glycomyces paridis TaxID=2126555 RepID=A0A4S8PMG9_9ACTN|nr:glycosyltransferase [Glycomyces paridis]THV31967.1 glycosyltransferase family 4 protein [Glycomyces paridis]